MKTRQKLMQHRNTAPKVDPDAQLAYMQIMISQHRGTLFVIKLFYSRIDCLLFFSMFFFLL